MPNKSSEKMFNGIIRYEREVNKFMDHLLLLYFNLLHFKDDDDTIDYCGIEDLVFKILYDKYGEDLEQKKRRIYLRHHFCFNESINSIKNFELSTKNSHILSVEYPDLKRCITEFNSKYVLFD